MKNKSIYNILSNSKRVNNYTKLILYLNSLNYYEDYYIPNRKIMKYLNINKPNTIRLLKQLEEDNIIKLFYKKRKRYFVILIDKKEENPEQNYNITSNYDYNWLEEE